MIVYKNSNTFEIIEDNSLVVTGKISQLKISNAVSRANSAEMTPPGNIPDLHFTRSDVYREFRLRGHDYKGFFRGITSTNLEGNCVL